MFQPIFPQYLSPVITRADSLTILRYRNRVCARFDLTISLAAATGGLDGLACFVYLLRGLKKPPQKSRVGLDMT